MKNIAFITLAVPGKSILKSLMMINSLRSFGGGMKDSPVWVLVPETRNKFSQSVLDEISLLKSKLVPFKLPTEGVRIPFEIKIEAAAHAEALAKDREKILVWLDSDTIILREPDEFLLPEGIGFGYRPVHHKLVGPTWGEPLDPFWSLIYQTCEVPDDRQFQMITHTGEKTRPYFNAGTYAILPEKNLMTKWQIAFRKWSNDPEFRSYYQTDERYLIFIHQAIFTGVLLHELSTTEILELSPKINYPLHLHNEIPPRLRPKLLSDLTTVRYENIFETTDWQEKLDILKPILPWLNDQPLLHIKPEGSR